MVSKRTLGLRRSHVLQLARRNLSSHQCAEDPFLSLLNAAIAEHVAQHQRSILRSSLLGFNAAICGALFLEWYLKIEFWTYSSRRCCSISYLLLKAARMRFEFFKLDSTSQEQSSIGKFFHLIRYCLWWASPRLVKIFSTSYSPESVAVGSWAPRMPLVCKSEAGLSKLQWKTSWIREAAGSCSWNETGDNCRRIL